MTKLKAFLFALDNVAFVDGALDTVKMDEFGRLIKFLVARNVRPIVFANRSWSITTNGKKEPVQDHYKSIWPEVRWYIAAKDGFPPKPRKESVQYILDQEGLTANEVVFLGNDTIDMQAAVNGRVLLLTASWLAKPTDYGFRFDSVKDVARFIDLFCLRDHLWFYEVPEIELRCLGLVSSHDVTAGAYSKDAIYTFKNKDPKHRDFWTKYLVSTLYFAGIHNRVSLIAPYPSHAIGHDNEVVRDALITFAKCFRLTYCPDLIVRHKGAMKSQTARQKNIALSHLDQMNTIHITKKPSRHGDKPYVNSPFAKERSILVVDDFTTEGYGLTSARAYLRAIPKVKDVILVSLLRFPNKTLYELSPLPKITDPFKPNVFTQPLPTKAHSYTSGVVAAGSTQEIAEHFKQYDTWDWP